MPTQRKSLEEIFGETPRAESPKIKDERKSLDEIFGTGPSVAPVEAPLGKGMFSRLGQSVGGFAGGFVKGIGSTVAGAASLGERALEATAGRAAEAITGKMVGKQVTGLGEEFKEGVLRPVGTAEKIGFGVEQIGEFFLPTGAAAKGATAVSRFLPKAVEKAPRIVQTAAKLFPKAVGEAAEVSAKTLAQTGEIKEAGGAAALTAAIPFLGTGLRGAGRTLAQTTLGQAVVSALTEKMPARLVNSVIKPLSKEFRFGKDPGAGIAREGIVAKSFDDLSQKVTAKKQEIGKKIGETLEKYAEKKVDIVSVLSPLDEAIEKAAKMGPEGQGLVTRLNNLREGLTGTFQTIQGKVVRTGERNLVMSPAEAAKLKSELGEMITWTGQAFDNQINQAKSKVYGKLKNLIGDAAPEVRSLNERFANMVGAENAVQKTKSVVERHNLFGFSDLVITAPASYGFVTSLAQGDFDGAAKNLVFGFGLALSKKKLSSVQAKTKMANILAKLQPEEKIKLLQASPKLAAMLRGWGLITEQEE